MKNKHRSLLVGSLLLVLTAASGRAALVEEFLLNEGAANPSATVVSSTASTNLGTLSGTTLPVWQTANLPPIPGGATACLNFVGTSSVGTYVQTTSSAVTGTNARTIAFWLMAPNAPQPALACICSWGANSTGQRFTLRLDPGTSGGVLGALRLEDQGAFATGKTPLTDGKWHHIAIVYPGGPPTNSIFYIDGNVDGQSAGSSNVVNTTINANANTKLAIGTLPPVGVNSYGLNGSLADFQIYNTALTQSNILQLVYGPGVAPTISGGLSNQAAILGDTNATVTFTVNATGSGLNYFWLHGGTNLSAPNNTSLVLGPQLTDANLGSYTVIVSNDWGSITSAPVTLSWTTPAVDPSHQAAVVGGSAAFTIKNLPSYQTYSYQWQEAGQAISGATNSSYLRTNLSALDTTNFTMVLTLGLDKATSAPVQLVVVSISDPYASIVLGDNPMAYWRLNEVNGATVAVDQSTFDNGHYVNYNGSELGAAGALVNDSDTASTFDLSGESNYIEIPYDAALARTDSFTLEAWVNPASAGGTTYQSIIGSHTKNATAGAELGINGLRWDFRTGDSTDSATQTFDDLAGGTVTNNTWTHVVATFDGSVKRLYVNGVLIGSETTNLLASSVLWRIAADQTYQANAGQFFSGSIDEVAIYGNALSSGQVVNHYDMAAYGAGVAPIILMQPLTQTLGSGVSNITFTVVPGGTPPFTYQWFFDGTNLNGQTGNSLTITNAGVANLGSYTVAVGNNVNSTTSAPAQLTIAVSPSDFAALTGGSATFGVSLPTNVGYTFQWKFKGTSISNATGETLSLSSLTTNQAGNYALLVTLGGITVTSAPATLEVLAPPSDSYGNIVLNDAPVSWWRLGDAPGSTLAVDVMGQNTGGAFPDVTYGAQGGPLGDSDTAAQFTGYSLGARAGNSKIGVAYNPSLNNPVFSVECWALASGGAGTLRSPITSRSTNSGTAGYSLYAGTDDHWQFWVGNGGASWTVLEGPPISFNQWVHLVGVYDGANASFYVNGYLAGQTQTAFLANSVFGLNIGAGGTESIAGNNFFPGEIDEVAVYQTALSEAQIQQHYVAAFPSAAAPRFSSLPFNRAFLAGTAVTLNSIGYSAPPLAYQWMHNGTNLSGVTASSLSLPSVAAANAGNYQVILTHGSQSVTSAVTTLAVLNGEAASVHFKGFENTYTIASDGGRAGFVRATNWNEVGYQANSGTASNLINNLGRNTGMTVTWTANNNQRWNGPINVPQGDYALLSGFIDDNGNSTPVNVTIANIPASYQQSGYSLYVYMGAPNAQSGAVTSSSWFGAVSVGSVTNYYHAVDLATWNGEYLLATNSDPTDSAPTNANYAVFTGLNASSASIIVGEHPAGVAGPASISGFQLVANTVSAVSLNISNQGPNVVLSWTGAWTLQETPSLAGSPWTNVIGATSPYTNNINSQSNAFFRLVSP